MDVDYLPHMSLTAYLETVEASFPWLLDLLWFEKPGATAVLEAMVRGSNEFDTDHQGRGDSYRTAQRDCSVRLIGMKQLLALAAPDRCLQDPASSFHILDMLGGDGTLAKALTSHLASTASRSTVVTSDVSGHMVQGALDDGYPAIRQPAQFLFLKDESIDAALAAYGTHHLSATGLGQACREAYRVLKAGGTLVLHDFDHDSPMAAWFREVVDLYSVAGHDYLHFSKDQLAGYLREAGFRNIETCHIYDPFIVHDSSEVAAWIRLVDYVVAMYGLVKLGPPLVPRPSGHRIVGDLIKRYMRYDYTGLPNCQPHWKQAPTVVGDTGDYIAEMPRIAVVAAGRK